MRHTYSGVATAGGRLIPGQQPLTAARRSSVSFAPNDKRRFMSVRGGFTAVSQRFHLIGELIDELRQFRYAAVTQRLVVLENHRVSQRAAVLRRGGGGLRRHHAAATAAATMRPASALAALVHGRLVAMRSDGRATRLSPRRIEADATAASGAAVDEVSAVRVSTVRVSAVRVSTLRVSAVRVSTVRVAIRVSGPSVW